MPKSKTKSTTDAAAAARDARKKVGNKKSHLFVLMDESGSMMGLGEHVISGCNEFLEQFKDDKKARMWLAWFDYHPGEPPVRFKVEAKKPTDVTRLGIGDYQPRGMTPLYDAILESLARLDKTVGKDEGVFMAIITDGQENKSEADAATVKAAIERYEKRGWAFVYIGANVIAEQVGPVIGVQNVINFNASPTGTRRAANFASQTAREYSAGGQSASYASAASTYQETGGTLPDEDDEPEEKS